MTNQALISKILKIGHLLGIGVWSLGFNIMTIEELKSILARFRIRPDKKLGQNFLLSEEVLDRIVEAGELGAKDRVLEIGPGLGFLTRRLAQNAGEVVAIEKDWKLVQVLRKIFKRFKNVKIIHGDALDPLLLPLTKGESKRGYKVIANIPYYLTGKILQDFLTAENKPSLMVLLLQKEVAQRIVAKPGEMSLLSVSVQFYADPEIIAEVPKENFYPVPEVDSAVVRLTPLSSPLAKGGKRGVGARLEVDEGNFFRLVKIGFANKRKQLQNNLRVLPLSFSGLTRESRNDSSVDYKIILKKAGLNPLARAQDLSLEDWDHLYQIFFPSLDPDGIVGVDGRG